MLSHALSGRRNTASCSGTLVALSTGRTKGEGISAPVVQPPDWTKSFHVFVDASDIAIGSVLMQVTDPKWYRLVYYAIRKLSKAERNYSTTEREALGMVYSVTKYRHYLLGRKFSFNMDHPALLYLVSKASLTGKIA